MSIGFMVPMARITTACSHSIHLLSLCFEYIVNHSNKVWISLNLSSHWFWRTCASVSFSSSCFSSSSPSSFSFSFCNGGQRTRMSCLNRRKRWCPEAAAAVAGSYRPEVWGGEEEVGVNMRRKTCDSHHRGWRASEVSSSRRLFFVLKLWDYSTAYLFYILSVINNRNPSYY